MATLDDLFNKAEKEFEEVIERFKEEVAKLSIGAADVQRVKEIQVNVYDTTMPIYQVASVLAPNAMTVVVTPWDKNILKQIAEALASELKDITPTIKDNAVYLNFPPITEEKKKEYLKLLSKIAERYRQQLRDVRNEFKKKLEQLHKEHSLPDNDFYKAIERLDELTREYRAKIDETVSKKEDQLNIPS